MLDRLLRYFLKKFRCTNSISILIRVPRSGLNSQVLELTGVSTKVESCCTLPKVRGQPGSFDIAIGPCLDLHMMLLAIRCCSRCYSLLSTGTCQTK